MGMGAIVLEHKVVGPILPEQEGSRPAVLGHKVDTLVTIGRRGFVPGALRWQEFELVQLGQ